MDIIEILDLMDDVAVVDELVANHPRVFTRKDPFTVYSDAEFKLRYRFSKETVTQLISLLSDDLKRLTRRNNSLTPATQVGYIYAIFA